jgi:hypothetical protein
MGDVILKQFFISIGALLLLCNSSLFGDSSADIARYDRYFNEISEIRVGIVDREIDVLANPFITLAIPRVPGSGGNATAAPTFKLNAIIENKVKINDSWLSKGSLINGMRVIAIKQRSVVLGSTNRGIELFLREKNENSIITTN